MPEIEPKKEQPLTEKEAGAQIWLTVYADMVTNLMLFFLMLFAFTRLSVEIREDLFSKIAQQFGGIAKLIVEKPEPEPATEFLKNLPSVIEDEKMIKVILPSPVLFPLGKDEIKPEGKEPLKEVARFLKTNNLPVFVEGHTCDLPITGGKFNSNWELSSARALSVIRFFDHYCGLSPKRFTIMGHSQYSPVAPNDCEENRAKNRRIEIIIRKK